MGGDVRYPSLYQINTRVWLRRLSRQGKTVTLKEVPDEERSVIMSSVIDRSSVQVKLRRTFAAFINNSIGAKRPIIKMVLDYDVSIPFTGVGLFWFTK